MGTGRDPQGQYYKVLETQASKFMSTNHGGKEPLH